ncbi:hypothetical protein [Pseudomonas sp. A-RE-19]|uniref:hypothetical protein n=1 Tax=Pseudomonas sp. A-RE-19 TaxID=2832401 RepID=UPI001CBB58B1|nr:hypothetical protein [Pseudomonas sp. A-RE-19]
MNTTNASTTTPHQQYLGQLAEYDALLDHLRDAKARNIALAGIYFTPQPHSPLAQEHDVGQIHLHSLLGHPDYLALSEKLNITNFLSVSTAEGRSVYETADQHGTEVILSMTENPGWRELTGKIEQIALSIGGQLRSDKLLSLPQVLVYYGLPAAQPQSTAEMDSVIRKLEERRANHSLQLANGVDIDALNRAPTAKDRKILKSIKRVFPTSTMTMDRLITQRTNRNIIDIVRRFLPETENSLFSHLLKEALPSATYAQVGATPTVVLEKILRSAASERLGKALLEGLNWYGGKTDEETSSGVQIKLVSKAIRLWTHRDGKPRDIAGYPWHRRSNWGKSYPSMWAEFEQHLFDSRRASSMTEAILLARLLQPEFPREFQVPDIPLDLPYRSSVVWVNFVHGVTLAEAMDSDMIERMTFQQLVDFPLRQSMRASPQELELIALCRIPPTVEWAITNGIIAESVDTDYSPEEKKESIKALDEHTDALKKAIIQLDVSHPERSAIAEREMKKYFKDRWEKDHNGRYRKVFNPNQTYITFISDGRKLIEDFESGGGGVIQTPPPRDKAYSFRDVYMSGRLNKNWFITLSDGIRRSEYSLSINADRTIKTTAPWLPAELTKNPLPDAEKIFESEFKDYLELSKSAYQTLLKSLFFSLPYADRQAIEQGEIKIHTLRKSTSGIKHEDETPEMKLPLRLRMGFILQVTFNTKTSYYECLPRAGIIRNRVDFSSAMLDGHIQAEQIKGSFLGEMEVIAVRRGKRIPCDWRAHEKGSLPRDAARCDAIIDQFGETFAPPSRANEDELSALATVTLSRTTDLANYIANNLFYYDERLLHAAARGETELERIAANPHWLESVKGFIPFWGSISDLDSDDPKKRGWAIFGLIVDVVSFAFPLGKFASGSMKLISTAVRSGVRVALPKFGALSQKLLVSSVQNMIPFYGAPTLALRLSRGALGGMYAGIKFTVRKSYNSLMPSLGRAGKYHFIEGLPQVTDPGRWTPLTYGDQLATLRGVEDVPVRSIGSSTRSTHYLIDPVSAKPYGPALKVSADELSIGPSLYPTVGKNSDSLLFNIPEETRVREMLEVDGRTTLFIDDVPYRLDGDTLRRADMLDVSDTLRPIPCRPLRAPGAVCETRYVTRDPAPTPATGSFDESKGWAPWFGDSIYTNGARGAPMKRASIATHRTLGATMEFRKGIYGRVKVSVPDRGVMDTLEEGAIIVDASDGAKQYVFTRLNAGDFLVAELATGQSLREALTFKQASTLPAALREELMVVYTGSLNANNMVRIHGQELVERALRTMDDIAIPIGGHANPPDTLKLLRVDTSPAEAVLFDHSTRMIVSRLPEGAKSWTRSKDAPRALRHKTVEIFNTLFLEPTVVLRNPRSALQINKTMQKLQNLIPKRERSVNARNIAYAEVTTTAGTREVYISVSGAQGTTGHLPLFKQNGGLDHVNVGETTYFNIDYKRTFPNTSLNVTSEGKLLAVPHTIKDIDTYTPSFTRKPTSLDSESKLISFIREKYPDPQSIKSVDVATTMRSCDSCSVVIKEFGYDGGENALNVLWN